MNILYIGSLKIPSDEANVINKVNMVNSFAKNGNKVTFIMMQEGKKYFGVKKYIREQYDVKSKFRLLIIPMLSRKTAISCEFIAVFLSRVAYRCDVVVTRSLRIANMANTLGLKVIFDSHRPAGFKDHENEGARKLEKNVVLHKNTIRIITTTEIGARYYRKVYGEGIHEKIKVARNGAVAYDIRQKIEVDKTYNIHAGYFGQLYTGKGMEIISRLIVKHPDVFFHIAGGPDKEKKHWEHILHGSKNVRFYGYLDQKNLAPLRNSCDILLAPYKEIVTIAGGSKQINVFSSSIKLFEYMASKKAIIASNNPEILEILEHNRNAVLVDNSDIHSWSNALLMLSKNSRLREKLAGQVYRDYIKNNYSWDRRAELFLEDLSI